MGLSRDHILAWMLHHDVGYRTAAARFGMSDNTISSWIKRERVKLRKKGLAWPDDWRPSDDLSPPLEHVLGVQDAVELAALGVQEAKPTPTNGGNGGGRPIIPPAAPQDEKPEPAKPKRRKKRRKKKRTVTKRRNPSTGTSSASHSSAPAAPPAPPSAPPDVRTGSGIPTFMDPAIRDAIKKALIIGVPRAQVAAMIKIPKARFTAWIKKGRQAQEQQLQLDQVAPGQTITKQQTMYLGFYMDVVESEGQFVRGALAGIQKAIHPADGRRPDGRLALLLLERRFPDDFGQQSRHVVEGGSPIQHDHSHSFDFTEHTPEQLAGERRRLEEMIALRKTADKAKTIEGVYQEVEDE